MIESGFIHFDCFCGADLYYLVDQPSVDNQSAAKRALLNLIQHPHFAIFTNHDGPTSECPHCGALVELPDPEIVAFLSRKSRTRREQKSFEESVLN
jgi:hypothetical protein